jgi:hypothetical protein
MTKKEYRRWMGTPEYEVETTTWEAYHVVCHHPHDEDMSITFEVYFERGLSRWPLRRLAENWAHYNGKYQVADCYPAKQGNADDIICLTECFYE